MNATKLTVATLAVAFGVLIIRSQVVAAEWPMLGRDGARNPVSSETGAPAKWSVEERRDGRLISAAQGIRWTGPLGFNTYSSPVVSGGLVWIGTNKVRSDTKLEAQYDCVLKCFRVSDGKLVYEYSSLKLGTRVQDPGWTGLGSSPLVEGDRLWITTNRSEVVCLDIGPLIRGEGEPRELWKFDLLKEFDFFLHVPLMGPSLPCSIGASWNGRIYVTIANSVGEDRKTVPKPDAPSLVCLNKETGKVHWKDNSPGANILVTQFASPTVAEIAGQVQVIVPQSDGWLRGFDPETGEKLWEFDVNAKASVHTIAGECDRNSFLANAVVYENRVYVASGQEIERGQGLGRLVCIDPTKRGDVSNELVLAADGNPAPRRRAQAIDMQAGEKVVPNPNSGLAWEFTNCGKDVGDIMHRTMGSVAIANDLVIAADYSGVTHCLDAKTGKQHWSNDAINSISASPLIVGENVYIADVSGDVAVFQLGADPKHSDPTALVEHSRPIHAAPVFSDGALYIPTGSALIAVNATEARRWYQHIGHWPQWRGANRDNRSSETGLLSSWPDDGPPLAWRIDGLGDGIASLAVADGRVFTSTTYVDSEYAVALDEGTGERLWVTRIGSAIEENPLMRWLSQRTPTVDGNRVYVLTNTGWLFCLNATTGQIVWRINYPHEFGTLIGKWGFCDRPLVDGEKLICTPGGSKATLVALDKRTGKVVWSKLQENREACGYAAPLLIETDGLKQYVVVLDKGIAAFAANDGRFLWRYDRDSDGRANSYTPLVVENGLLCPNGYASGIARIKLTRREDTISVEEQYFQKASFDPFEDSALLVDGSLFAFRAGGVAGCIDVNNGGPLWTSRRVGLGKAAATFADGHVYSRWADGTIALIEANSKSCTEISHFKLSEARKSIGSTFPVVAGGRLYVRDNDRLYCYDVLQRPQGEIVPKPRFVKFDPPTPADASPVDRVASAIFVPTPQDVVEKMLAAANIGKDDVVYDLGSGDGRVIIEAARKYQCRAVGLEIDRDLVKLSRERVLDAKMDKRVSIKDSDIFSADFSEATVVTVYLYPGLLTRLLPQFEKLKPGTRIVAHQFAIPDLPPEKTFTVTSDETAAEHTVYLWTAPLPKRKVTRRIAWPGVHSYHTAFSSDGRLYLAGGDSGALRVWEVDTGKQLLELPISVGVFTPDNRFILGHNVAGTFVLFDVASGKEVRRWGSNPILSLAIAPDGKQAISSHADKALRVWDISTGQEIRKFEGHGESTSAVYSPDGKQILTTCADKTVQLLDAETGLLVRSFDMFPNAVAIPGHDLIVRATFLPGGRQIAGYVWGQDKRLLIWDVANGKVSKTIELGADHHKDAVLSPDGRLLLTAHEDHTLRLRDLTNGKEIRRFETADVVPRGLTFSSDGRFAASGSYRGWVYLWQLKD